MTNIVILAAGAGTRLAPFTNHMPKALLKVGKQTALLQNLNFWYALMGHQNYKLILVVHKEHEQLFRAYIKVHLWHMGGILELRVVEDRLGSAKAIVDSLHDVSGHTILQWCDVILSTACRNIDIPPLESDFRIWTNDSIHCRFAASDSGVTQVSNNDGNVIGLYQFKDYKPFQYNDGDDLIDCINELGSVEVRRTEDLDISVSDFGDIGKYISTNIDDGAREFNTLDMLETTVVKKPQNEKGRALIASEKAWYNTSHWNGRVPMVMNTNDDSLTLEKLNGSPLYKVFQDADLKQRSVLLQKVCSLLHDIHMIGYLKVTQRSVMEDITIEAHTKLVDRCKLIAPIIDAFGVVRYVNGVEINQLDDVLSFLLNRIKEEHKDCTYVPIHGDSQMSNIFWCNDGTLKLLDPRGYFGNSKIFGPKSYDYAKVLYSLSGYDQFNYSKDFFVELKDDCLNFDIPTIEVERTNSLGNIELNAGHWLPVIWIGLAEYIKNDPIKSIAAYYHGLYLATKMMNDYGKA